MAPPDTIVLIHGFWVTPLSWEKWIPYYESKGYKVVAPAYPGLDAEVAALNEDPAPIEALTVEAIVEHLEGVLAELDSEPILIGHSAGGVFTQLLLDRGHGAAAVTICSAPTEGVSVVPLTQVRSTFPVLKNPANHHRAVAFTPEQWKYAFANTLSEDESMALYERYAIPAPGRIVWDSVLAMWQPGHQSTHVDYKNDERAPLLFISATADHIMPPKVQRSNAKHYKSDKTVTETREVPGDHAILAEEGWEEIADMALEWAVAQAGVRS